MEQHTVTVYCASSDRLDPVYVNAAYELGQALALAGARLVTGGGKTGLMEAVERGALAHGGTAIGVIPQFMVDRGWHNTALSQLEIVPDMHTRKATMARLSTASIALPGGIGTFEELMEILTWRQLGLYDGNIVIYNVNGYYDPMLEMLERCIGQGFMPAKYRSLYAVATGVEQAVKYALAEPSHETFPTKFNA